MAEPSAPAEPQSPGANTVSASAPLRFPRSLGPRSSAASPLAGALSGGQRTISRSRLALPQPRRLLRSRSPPGPAWRCHT
eukprot:3634073-Alexandrium_andersonii.AAC.1